MKNTKLSIATLVVAFGALLMLSSSSAKAETYPTSNAFTYHVEVRYHFFHWTSGGEYYYWDSLFETSSYSEALTIYHILRDALEDGNLDYLNSSGPTTITTVVDVRLRMVRRMDLFATPNPYTHIQNNNYLFKK